MRQHHPHASMDAVEAAQAAWQKKHESWSGRNPALVARVAAGPKRQLPESWDSTIPNLTTESRSRARGFRAVLNAIAAKLPELIGGSANLAPSNSTIS